jgi:hypothetical protein
MFAWFKAAFYWKALRELVKQGDQIGRIFAYWA